MKKNDILVQRIKLICDKREVTQTKMESDLGYSQGIIARWSKTNPSYEKIYDIAEYLNVSIDYLVGRSNIESTIDQIKSDADLITLQKQIESMNYNQKKRIFKIIQIFYEEIISKDK